MLSSFFSRCLSGDFAFLLGMEKGRVSSVLEQAGIDFSFFEMQAPGIKSGVLRVVKQEMVNGSLLLTISLFDVLGPDALNEGGI
ncbi:MAG: hypothetical protein ACOX8S_02655 [Christensenellales bacterium]